jgi:hypothetical protein
MSVECFNIKGKTVFTDIIPQNASNYKLQISTFAKGTYLLRFNDGKHTFSNKFIKQ